MLTNLLLFSKYFLLSSSFLPILICMHNFLCHSFLFNLKMSRFHISIKLQVPFISFCWPWLSLPISYLYLQGPLFNIITYTQILSQGLPWEELKSNSHQEVNASHFKLFLHFPYIKFITGFFFSSFPFNHLFTHSDI